MVDISQTVNLDKVKVANIVAKYSKARYMFSGTAIKDDLVNLDKMSTRYTMKTARKNIANTKKYLEMLLKRANKPINLLWVFDKESNSVVSLPIEMVSLPMGINTYDYIILDRSKKLVSIDYRELLSLMVFEASYIDLGKSDEPMSLREIDNILYDAGINITDTNRTDKLEGIIPPNIYKDALVCMIEDSRYINKEGMIDYFNNEIELQKNKKTYYYEWIKSSGNVAMTICLKDILSKASNERIDLQIAGITHDTISIVVDRDLDITKIVDNVRVMIFGRKFLVEPKVCEY